MSTVTGSENIQPWSEEPTDDPAVRRARAHIGGLHCSLCTGTIERALGQKSGVRRVAVSLTHEQALVEYDTRKTTAASLMDTLRAIGYTLSDPRKVEPYERQERELARGRTRFLIALAASLAAVGLLVDTDPATRYCVAWVWSRHSAAAPCWQWAAPHCWRCAPAVFFRATSRSCWPSSR